MGLSPMHLLLAKGIGSCLSLYPYRTSADADLHLPHEAPPLREDCFMHDQGKDPSLLLRLFSLVFFLFHSLLNFKTDSVGTSLICLSRGGPLEPLTSIRSVPPVGSEGCTPRYSKLRRILNYGKEQF